MADVLNVSFKIDTSGLEGQAAAAGALAAQGFKSGFGSVDLRTPMAKAGEAAQKQAAAIGESLHAATVSHAAPGGEARPSSEAAEASKKRREELHEEAEGIQRAAAGARMLHAGLELVGGSLSGAGLAVGARAFGEFAKSSIEAGGGAGKLAETAEKLAPVITTVVGALAAGAVISHEFAEKGAEAREELDAMSKSSGIGTESLVKFGSLMRGRGVDISEFGRSVALLQTRLQQGRGEIEKLASEEPRQTADAQLQVRDAYRKREEATVSLADAEEKVIGGKARSAVTLAGAAIRDQIAKEKGPMDVVAAMLGLGEAQEGQRHDAAIAPLNIASAQKRLEIAGLGPEREDLQFAEAKEGVRGAQVNYGSALIQARSADIADREAHGERVSGAEKRQLRMDAADQASTAAWEHVREAGLGITAAKFHQEEVATGAGAAQIDIGKALEELISVQKQAVLQQQSDRLKVQGAGLGVRAAEGAEAERQASFKVTGSNIVGALSPQAQIEHDKNVEKLDAIGLARAADQPAAADRGIGRAEDTLKFQGLGQVTQLAGRILTGQGPDITKASPEILLPALQQAAKQAYGEDSGLLGVFKALAKFIQREPESAAIAPMMQKVFPRIAALPHGDVQLTKVRGAFGDPSLDIEGTINRPTDENEKLRASPEQLEKAEGMAIAGQRLSEAQKDVQAKTLETAGPGLTKGASDAAKLVESGGDKASSIFGEIANGIADITGALVPFTKAVGAANKSIGEITGASDEQLEGAEEIGVVGGAGVAGFLGLRKAIRGIRGGVQGLITEGVKGAMKPAAGATATPETPAEAAPAEALPEAVKAPIELPRFLGAGSGSVPEPTAPAAPALAPSGAAAPTGPAELLGGPSAALPAMMLLQGALSGMNAARATSLSAAEAEGPLTPSQFGLKEFPKTEATHPPEVREPPRPAEVPRPSPVEAGGGAGAAGALMGAAGALTGAAGALQGAAGALAGAAGAKGGTPVENATEKAAGGLISGPGSGTSDSIPAWLSHGEYVVKADRVQQLGVPFLDQLNAGKFEFGGLVRGFAEGGEVTPSAFDPGPGWLERARAINLAAQAKAKGDADKAKADAEKERSAPQYGAYGSLEEANKDVGDAKAWEGYRIPVAGENATPPPDPAKPRSKLSDVKEMADVSVDYGGGNKKTFNVHKSHGLQGMPQHPGEGEGWKWEGGLLVDPQGNYSNPDGGDKPSQKRHAASSPGLETPFESLPEVHDDGEKPIRFPGVLAHHAHHHAHPQRAAGASDDDMWNPDRKLSFGGLIPGFAEGGLARVSNGEYRIGAGAVTKYGARLMAMLNSSGQFSSGGLVGDADTSNPGRFDDWGNGMSRGLSASLPPGISSQDHGTHSEHTLDLVTSAGQFRMQASADTIEAIRASAIGQKLTSTGVKPGWY